MGADKKKDRVGRAQTTGLQALCNHALVCNERHRQLSQPWICEEVVAAGAEAMNVDLVITAVLAGDMWFICRYISYTYVYK